MKASRLLILVLSVLTVFSAVSLVSQSSGDVRAQEHTPPVIKVTMTEQGFVPNVLVIRDITGSKVKIQIVNESTKVHGFLVKINGKEEGLADLVQPHTASSFVLSLPQEDGTFEFYSPTADGIEKGFKGKMVIQLLTKLPK